jgi:carbamoyl-phosphate synthase small subunit
MSSNFRTFGATLYLENGLFFKGKGFGLEKIGIGEVVFNTSITGYQEIITDPSYAKQIITFTHPHIGNVGTNDEDCESNGIYASGIIIKNLSMIPSSWRSQKSLEQFCADNDCIGIANIDTRELTNILREHGSLRGCIVPDSLKAGNEVDTVLKKFSGLAGLDLAKEVSTKSSYQWDKPVWNWGQKLPNDLHILVMDYGVKRNILRLLRTHVGLVTVVNAETTFEEVMQLNPDGVFLSNGPGDPEPCTYAIKLIQLLIENNMPVFGICLGHQLLGLASGCKTYKMKFGHHGGNHPVKDLQKGTVMITSQNHGFAVDDSSVPSNIDITHLSLFDGTIQGIALKNHPAFSFQGHPEASPGPHDLLELFTQFRNLIKDAKKN